jgi:SAM-dependent methyltransferase
MMKDNPEIIDGIKCYAPELAFDNKDFDKNAFGILYKLEEKNFWFRARNNVLKILFGRYFGKDTGGKFLEIGCGTGFVLKGLEKFKNLKLFGAEIYLEGLKYSKLRLPDVEFVQLDATTLPFEKEFDCIGAFDVLEHIEKDENVMAGVYKALKEKGFFFISVPQYMFMWSYLDDIACHKRRYSKKEIVTKLEKTGFEVVYTSSFVFLLFPLMYISRLLQKNKNENSDYDPLGELKINFIVNFIFRVFMKIDEWLIKLGIRLPFGGSLIVIARKLSR